MEVAIAPEGLYLPALGDAERIASVYARAMLRSGALRFVARAGISRALHMGRYEAWAHRLLVRHAPGGAAHLVLVAVDPDLQGRGWAGKLIRPVLAELDGSGASCCLETQNPGNVPLYEHLGFRVALSARLPGTDVGHWVMVRLPSRTA